MNSENSHTSIEVLFPLNLLKPDPILLDPNNLDTTSEYYLLENLAVGLLRDDLTVASGYTGGIADTWTRERLDWRFSIKPDLKYSDGETVQLEEIAEALRVRSKSNARHLKLLSRARTITTRKDSNEIVIAFDEEIDDALLSELSLADAAIITEKTRDSAWRKTLAPYFVASFHNGRSLVLKKNRNSPIAYSHSPDAVELRFSVDEDERISWFEKKEIDLFDPSAFSFKRRNKRIEALGYKKIYNRPNVVHFFVPNENSIYSEKSGLVTATLVLEMKKELTTLEKGFSYYDQLIPPEYSGVLENFEASVLPAIKDNISGKIALFADFREWPEFELALKTAAKNLGWNIEIVYFDRFAPYQIPDDVIARTYAFKGNQKDANGSWAFLFHSQYGALAHFRRKAGARLNDNMNSAQLRDLHGLVLKNHWAVPFMIESPMIFHSNRVSLERWNPFDLRQRFYEMILK